MSFNVAFSCKAVGLGHGECVKVVGNSPSLGNNDLTRAVTLHTSVDTHPYYETSTTLPLNATSVKDGVPELNISYQYALFSGGRFKRWEDGEEPRSLRVSLPAVDVDHDEPSFPDDDDKLIAVVVDVFSRPSTVSPGPLPQSNVSFVRLPDLAVLGGRYAYRRSVSAATASPPHSPTNRDASRSPGKR